MRSPKRHLFVNAVRQAINGLKTDFKAQDVGCSLNTTHQAALHSSTIFESKSDATTAVCDHMDDLCHEIPNTSATRRPSMKHSSERNTVCSSLSISEHSYSTHHIINMNQNIPTHSPDPAIASLLAQSQNGTAQSIFLDPSKLTISGHESAISEPRHSLPVISPSLFIELQKSIDTLMSSLPPPTFEMTESILMHMGDIMESQSQMLLEMSEKAQNAQLQHEQQTEELQMEIRKRDLMLEHMYSKFKGHAPHLEYLDHSERENNACCCGCIHSHNIARNLECRNKDKSKQSTHKASFRRSPQTSKKTKPAGSHIASTTPPSNSKVNSSTAVVQPPTPSKSPKPMSSRRNATPSRTKNQLFVSPNSKAKLSSVPTKTYKDNSKDIPRQMLYQLKNETNVASFPASHDKIHKQTYGSLSQQPQDNHQYTNISKSFETELKIGNNSDCINEISSMKDLTPSNVLPISSIKQYNLSKPTFSFSSPSSSLDEDQMVQYQNNMMCVPSSSYPSASVDLSNKYEDVPSPSMHSKRRGSMLFGRDLSASISGASSNHQKNNI